MCFIPHDMDRVFAVRQPLARRRPRKARISSWGPTTQTKQAVTLLTRSLRFVAESGGPHGQMAAEAGNLLAATAAPLATS